MSELKKEYLPKYTYEDYKHWEGRWELINGIPYSMSPAPGLRHQGVSAKISYQLLDLLENCEKCNSFIPIDWRIPNDSDDTVLQPDNLVICKDVKENYITEAPTLIFEILSPSTASKDKHIKYDIYESREVKYYAIVDIDLKSADVFELRDKKYYKIIEAKNDSVKFELDNDCVINFNFSEIWV
ncbi:MAG: Uma2 family endonuclease [Bacteroidota bacterium]|nr:Uma2 family endonuclease [Bacteroidota bacterium]